MIWFDLYPYHHSMIAYELLIILMMLRWVWKSCPELKLWFLLTKSMISTEREEIICGIITMLYINKYHNYNLNWGVIHRILWFFLPSNRINRVKTFSSPTRLVPPQDSRHWTGNLAKNNAKVQNGTKSFSFFFILIAWLPERNIVLNFITRVFDLFPYILICKNHRFLTPNIRINHAKNKPNKFFSPILHKFS